MTVWRLSVLASVMCVVEDGSARWAGRDRQGPVTSDQVAANTAALFGGLCRVLLDRPGLAGPRDRLGLVSVSDDPGAAEFTAIHEEGMAHRRSRVSARVAPLSGLNAHLATASIDLGITGPGIAAVFGRCSDERGLSLARLLLDSAQAERVVVAGAEAHRGAMYGAALVVTGSSSPASKEAIAHLGPVDNEGGMTEAGVADVGAGSPIGSGLDELLAIGSELEPGWDHQASLARFGLGLEVMEHER